MNCYVFKVFFKEKKAQINNIRRKNVTELHLKSVFTKTIKKVSFLESFILPNCVKKG